MVHEGSVREDSKLLAVSENPNPSAGKFLFHQLDDETDSNLFASLLRFLSAAVVVVVAADVVVAAPPVVVAAAVVVAGAAVVAAPPVVVAALAVVAVVAAAADVAGAAALGFRNCPSASVDEAVPGSFVARNHADPSGQNPLKQKNAN